MTRKCGAHQALFQVWDSGVKGKVGGRQGHRTQEGRERCEGRGRLQRKMEVGGERKMVDESVAARSTHVSNSASCMCGELPFHHGHAKDSVFKEQCPLLGAAMFQALLCIRHLTRTEATTVPPLPFQESLAASGGTCHGNSKLSTSSLGLCVGGFLCTLTCPKPVARAVWGRAEVPRCWWLAELLSTHEGHLEIWTIR